MSDLLCSLPPELLAKVFAFLPSRALLRLEPLSREFYNASRIVMNPKFVNLFFKQLLETESDLKKVSFWYLFVIEKYNLKIINFDILFTGTFEEEHFLNIVLDLSRIIERKQINEIIIDLNRNQKYIEYLLRIFQKNPNQQRLRKIDITFPSFLQRNFDSEKLLKYLNLIEEATITICTRNEHHYLLFPFWKKLAKTVKKIQLTNLCSTQELTLAGYFGETRFRKVKELSLDCRKDSFLFYQKLATNFPSVENLTARINNFTLLLPFRNVKQINLKVTYIETIQKDSVNAFLDIMGEKIRFLKVRVDERSIDMHWNPDITPFLKTNVYIPFELDEFPMFLDKIGTIEKLEIDFWDPFTLIWLLQRYVKIRKVVITKTYCFSSQEECIRAFKSILGKCKDRNIRFILRSNVPGFRKFKVYKSKVIRWSRETYM